MRTIILALVLLTACKKSSTPPPIVEGKCLVDTYKGHQAMKQTCTHVGYNWTCTYDEEKQINSCSRGAEASAVSERLPAATVPPALVAPPPVGSGSASP